MRWSARSKATLSFRTFNCFKSVSAPSGESLPITRYSAPYFDRRSRSMARNTSVSSSTLSKIGFATILPRYFATSNSKPLPRLPEALHEKSGPAKFIRFAIKCPAFRVRCQYLCRGTKGGNEIQNHVNDGLISNRRIDHRVIQGTVGPWDSEIFL